MQRPQQLEHVLKSVQMQRPRLLEHVWNSVQIQRPQQLEHVWKSVQIQRPQLLSHVWNSVQIQRPQQLQHFWNSAQIQRPQQLEDIQNSFCFQNIAIILNHSNSCSPGSDLQYCNLYRSGMLLFRLLPIQIETYRHQWMQFALYFRYVRLDASIRIVKVKHFNFSASSEEETLNFVSMKKFQKIKRLNDSFRRLVTNLRL